MTQPYNALYGSPQAPQDNALYYDDTQGMPRQRPADPLRWLANAIGQNKDLPAPQFFMDPRALSARNMLHSALNTSANWLDGTKDPSLIGPQEMVSPLGLAGMGMALAPRNSVGMFGGRLAQTADHNALAKAEQLAASGAPREDVWKQTGWFQGKDGKWRFEIDDSKSAVRKFDDEFADLGGRAMPADLAWKHDELFKAYPAASDVPYSILQRGDPTHAQYQAGAGITQFGGKSSRENFLHEMQHDIQRREGFASGANAYDPIYPREAGEVEARAAASRRDLTADERRARPPWLDYDVPEYRQIVRSVMADNAKGSAPGTVVNSLDMSEAARMARAKEMGFDTDRVLYHGSQSKFSEFDPSLGHEYGIFLSPNKGYAQPYAGLSERGTRNQPGAYFVRAEKVARPHSTEDLAQSANKHLTKADADRLRAQGIDAIEPKEVPEFVLFDPAKIRSVDAAFDPAKRDSADLLASSPSASAPGLAANSTQPTQQDDQGVMSILRRYGLAD